MLLGRLVRPGVEEMVAERRWMDLREVLSDWAAPEVADLLVELPRSDRAVVFRLLNRERAAEVFAHLESEDQNILIGALTNEETRLLLADLPPDDRTQLLEELPGRVTQKLLNLLSPGDLKEARHLLGYPEESVGRLMTPDYVAVRPEWTVRRVLEHVRAKGRYSETINRIFVVEQGWRLVDDIDLRRLILADPDATVSDVMDHTFVAIPATADREEAVRLIQRYDQVALPVTDSAGVLVGMVTVDDVLDVAEEEATEDFHRVGSVEPLRGSLRAAGIGFLFRRRVGWLLVLVGVNIFSGAGIAYFEDVIAATVALVFFLPLLIDSAGNAGSQAATLVVRAMATGDVDAEDWLRLVGREVAVALGLGATMAAAAGTLGLFRGGSEVAVVVAITMVLVVLVGSVVGLSLPFLLERLGLDPATASAPLVTSIADISGVLIYFSVATWWLV